MASAREQAREAASAQVFFMKKRNLRDLSKMARVGADAASDVWEPIVRELYECNVRMVLTKGSPRWAAMVRAKEALDG